MEIIDPSATLVLPALGRPLQIGMLYDCRTDAMIPGVPLWGMELIRTNIHVTEQKTSDFKIIASDSIGDRASAFDIPAAFKASFLCGMVEVSGAAKYLKAKKTSKKRVRVTVMHTATTKFEQLTKTHLNSEHIINKNIFDNSIGTHVVTGVLYGAQACYVFEHGISSNQTKHAIYEELQKEVKMAISKLSVSTLLWHGCHFTEDIAIIKPEKCKLNQASCTFSGDYALKGELSTREQAASVLHNLPVFADSSDATMVPIKVWLSPLIGLLKAMRNWPVRTEEVQVVMEELSDIDVRCEDLLDEPAAMHFADITSKIKGFSNLCQRYRLSLQKVLSVALVSARRGREEESALMDILAARKQSPFNTEHLSEYIDSFEKEVGFVSCFLNWAKTAHAVNTVGSQQEMNYVLCDPKVELVLLFNFTSLREEESHLLDLKHWLKRMEDGSHPTSSKTGIVEKSKKWFDDADINKRTREYMNEFIEFANSNILNEKIQFIVSAIVDPDNPGASIYLYEKGVLKSSSFHPPCLDAPDISSVSHDRVRLTCAPCPADSDQLLGYRVEYRYTRGDNWTIKERTDTNRAFAVTGLLPNSLYQFRQSAVLARWVTHPSDPTAMIKTLPCSPPGNVNELGKQPTSITLNWEEPDTIGTGTQVTEYKIEFKDERAETNIWTEVMTGKNTKTFTVQGLQSSSSYRFRVSAVCENSGSSFPSEESVFSTIVLAHPAELMATVPIMSFAPYYDD